MKKLDRLFLTSLLGLSAFGMSLARYDGRLIYFEYFEFDHGPLDLNAERIQFGVRGQYGIYRITVRVTNERVTDYLLFGLSPVTIRPDHLLERNMHLSPNIFCEHDNVFTLSGTVDFIFDRSWEIYETFTLDAVGQINAEITSETCQIKGPKRYCTYDDAHAVVPTTSVIYIRGFKREFDDPASPCIDFSTYNILASKGTPMPIAAGDGSRLELLNFVSEYKTGVWLQSMSPIRYWPIKLISSGLGDGSYTVRLDREYYYSASDLRMYEEKPDGPYFKSNSRLFFPIDRELLGQQLQFRLVLSGICPEKNRLQMKINGLVTKNKIGSCDTSEYCVLTDGGRL